MRKPMRLLRLSNHSFSLAVSGNGSATINFTVSGGDLNAAVNAFNDKSGQTGVTAKLVNNNTALQLTASDGSDIMVVDNGAASGATLGCRVRRCFWCVHLVLTTHLALVCVSVVS
jgi:hypothetical protein